jgi:wyosine [tRNA(Phe)-imidazoG37] synthetase (radical SAM superfamily)
MTIKKRNTIGLVIEITKTLLTLKKGDMKKDTLRTILTLVATLIATFFSIAPEVLNQVIDLTIILVSTATALYQVVLSILRPADDEIPQEVAQELENLRKAK